ncbi:hypothetical protein HMPREF0670_00714 [Prevotella sp. oral taxon 317 str. F0108]|nr:hypothetical protein HMPREF0670_00714 [Prevotella sp. oral taxon 317 str. F0108]
MAKRHFSSSAPPKPLSSVAFFKRVLATNCKSNTAYLMATETQ